MRGKRNMKPRRQLRFTPTLITSSTFESSSQHISEPDPSQSLESESLSQHISQDPSTQSSPSQSNQTPIAEWLQKDKIRPQCSPQANKTVVDIQQFESPSSREHRKETTKRKREEKKSLLETYKYNNLRYISSIQFFTRNLQIGKYDEGTVLNLVIRKTAEENDRLVRTIGFDLGEKRDRIILFKKTSVLVEGACIKLYSPWQEINISSTSEQVIIGADFFQVCSKNEFGLTDVQIQDILQAPLPQYKIIRTSEPIFKDLLPFRLRARTIRKQVATFATFVEIDVLILISWTYSALTLILVQDAVGFLSFLQYPVTCADLLPNSSVEKPVKLSEIAVVSKIAVSEDLPWCSILYYFGSMQAYFYIFKYDINSSWSHLESCDSIPLNKFIDCLVDIDDIDIRNNDSKSQDCRVSLKCKLKEKGADYILVTDDTDLSLKIYFVFHPLYDIQEVRGSVNSCVHLKFLRLVGGRTIWDRFTTSEEIMDIDDEF